MRIKECRQKKGISQAKLAEKLHVLQSTVAMWETGRNMPSADKLPALAAALGCSIDALFAEPEERAQESAGGEA